MLSQQIPFPVAAILFAGVLEVVEDGSEVLGDVVAPLLADGDGGEREARHGMGK